MSRRELAAAARFSLRRSLSVFWSFFLPSLFGFAEPFMQLLPSFGSPGATNGGSCGSWSTGTLQTP